MKSSDILRYLISYILISPFIINVFYVMIMTPLLYYINIV